MHDFILYGKYLLKEKDGLSSFKESVDIRFQEACKRMNLSPDNIDIKCFSSLEKESFMIQDNNRIKVYMDKHQMDSLYMLTNLLYVYGKIDLKYAVYSIILKRVPYFETRLSFSLLLLQAEKCFCVKKLMQAQTYLDAAETQDLTSCFKDIIENLESDLPEPENELILDILLHVGRRQDINYAFSLNFFVFHELAHAKYTLSKNELAIFTETVESFLSIQMREADNFWDDSVIQRPKIPIEEYVCDIYALYLLFDYVYEQQSDYEIEFMIDSYFAAVLNIALIHSKESDRILFSENDYVYAAVRAINVTAALRIIWAREGKPFSLLIGVEHATKDLFDRFNNVRQSLDKKWRCLYHLHHVEEPESLTIDEEHALIGHIIQRLSNIS